MNTPLNRRDFLKLTTAGAAATLLSDKVLRADSPAPVATTGPLKKAVLISMLPHQMSYEDRFKLAVDVGFQGVEAQTTADPKEADEIKAAADKAGLRIHSVMNMDHWAYPLSSADPTVVEHSLKGMGTSLRNAKLWGASTVLLVPAVVDSKTSYRDAYTRSQTQIRKLIPLAQELGVIIALEEVWNKFLLSPLEFARYVDEFNSPWIRSYFDVGNVVQYGYPQDWIRTLGKRIAKFHLKDFKRENNQFVALREGSIDWPEVRKAIGEIGYSGFLTTELNGGDEAYLRDVVARVDKIFAGI
ncbi:MAG: TIM barrel protein [Abitibacteriaceae bacterium]|nr:TIM barrel protein [Abditibacteriaceae bacterium]MBV9865879.1 TIM barrel protein [Abditibacteriaceae bacterium]